jgi:hypothetical protein
LGKGRRRLKLCSLVRLDVMLAALELVQVNREGKNQRGSEASGKRECPSREPRPVRSNRARLDGFLGQIGLGEICNGTAVRADG